MKKFRTLAAVSLLATSLMAAPVSAQTTGDNRGNIGCTQEQAGGGGGAGAVAPGDRSQENRQGVIAGLIAAAIGNIGVEASVLNDALNNANLQVVCLNNVLNQNDIALVENVLNRSPILSNNRNMLNDLVDVGDIGLLNDVNILAVDLENNTVYVVRG